MDFMYTLTRNKLWTASLGNVVTADLKLALMLSSHTPDEDNDEFVSDVAADIATNGRSASLTSKAVANGALDFDDLTILADGGQTVKALLLYIDSGADATSPLIAYRDSIVGFPRVTAPSGVQLVFSGGAFKYAALTTFFA